MTFHLVFASKRRADARIILPCNAAGELLVEIAPSYRAALDYVRAHQADFAAPTIERD